MRTKPIIFVAIAAILLPLSCERLVRRLSSSAPDTLAHCLHALKRVCEALASL